MPLRSLAMLFAAITALFAATAAQAAAPSPVLIVATPKGSHVVGKTAAPVKLVEYISYTCPHCAHFDKEAGDTITLLLVRTGKVSVEYRPFLRNIIDVAATLLVNCGAPSRFPANHSAVLRNQEKWMVQPSEGQIQRWNGMTDLPARIRAVAHDMGLYAMFETRGYSRPVLDRCLTNQKLVDTIAEENQAASKVVNGTPSFFIDGKLQDANDWAALRPLLEAATR